MTDWIQRYSLLAQHVAGWSKDPSSQVGAVIVGKDPRDIALGYNGFPKGVTDDSRLHDRGMKYLLTVHAERNALDNARFKCGGGLIAVTHYPCMECAKSIVGKGIKNVICPEPPPVSDERPWTVSCGHSAALFKEVGVRVLPTKEDGRFKYGYANFRPGEE